MPDPYEVLGVERGASEEEVKTAYRQKVKQYHPDRCEREDAEELFKQVKEAYEAVYERAEPSGEVNGEDGEKDTDRRGQEEPKSGERGAEEPYSTTDDGLRYKLFRSYDDGWTLGKGADGNWFVFRELETAPHIQEKETEYLRRDGSVTDEPNFFETKQAAQRTYEDVFGSEYVGEETEADGRPDPEETAGDRTADQRDWGEVRAERYLDGLWGLCYQERSDGEDRRWAVAAAGEGSGFIDDSGEHQAEEFWFETEEEAERAYRRYVGGTEGRGDPSRSPFRETGSGGPGGADSTGNRETEDGRVSERRRRRAESRMNVSDGRDEAIVDFTEFVFDVARGAAPAASNAVTLPAKAVLYLIGLPLLVPAKAVSFVGPKRVLGALAVAGVGPGVLGAMRVTGNVANPTLRETSLTEAFLYISLPALVLAAVLQFFYEMTLQR